MHLKYSLHCSAPLSGDSFDMLNPVLSCRCKAKVQTHSILIPGYEKKISCWHPAPSRTAPGLAVVNCLGVTGDFGNVCIVLPPFFLLWLYMMPRCVHCSLRSAHLLHWVEMKAVKIALCLGRDTINEEQVVVVQAGRERGRTQWHWNKMLSVLDRRSNRLQLHEV